MDLIHNFLNIVSVIISVISFIFILPILSLFRILRFCIRSVSQDKLAGKVVLITGASSGIGEHLAYEYAKHGASLALVARREDLLAAVAGKAKELGAPKVIVIKADVSKLQDCKRLVDETINHFRKLDYLINNAGIVKICLFEDKRFIADHASIMDVNFWGSIYATHFALPYLTKRKGRIIVIGSTGGWFNMPGMSVYNASKVAQQSFFETLRIELASNIRITMVTLGIVATPLAKDEVLDKGKLRWIPRYSVEGCAKAIVNSARRGEEYLTAPTWMQSVFLGIMLLPEIMNIVKQYFSRICKPKHKRQYLF
ncbi:unnamed protein product [Lactuca virosa]|uniref:3-oxoacyl-[acyl-carrier-protein] reductase n=1 Tax=Lactuca virosa TaxID=75947 RepID=A0AAU9LZC5_9ASTR|nr:unnamed protein product [Lactuca virosa]